METRLQRESQPPHRRREYSLQSASVVPGSNPGRRASAGFDIDPKYYNCSLEAHQRDRLREHQPRGE